MAASILLIVVCLCHYCKWTDSFTTATISSTKSKRRCNSFSPTRLTQPQNNHDVGTNNVTEIRYYEHNEWKCAYRYKPAECDNLIPLLLIHPVGIGMSSWFWNNLMHQYQGEVYAVDLIGCGTIGGDTWDPDAHGMFFPLTWVQQCEILLRKVICRPCAVVCQGAVAPVGVLLTWRDCQMQFAPENTSATWSNQNFISHLILSSPPTYKAMIEPLPMSTLRRNYQFYRSFLGGLAFDALENRFAIKLFSNLFLFDNPVDDNFITNAVTECKKELRSPIMAVNAGMLMHRSWKDELASISQPTLVLCGDTDPRRKGQRAYQEAMMHCTFKVIRGKNILPWE